MEYEAFGGIAWHRPVFWVAVAFVIFVVLFGARLWKALMGMLDARTAAVRAELAEAAALRAEAERLLADARARRETAIADAKHMLEAAQAEAARVAASLTAEAEESARRRERMAIDRIASAEKAALAEVRTAAASVAATAAQRVIAESLTPDADAALIDQAITGLPQALRSAA